MPVRTAQVILELTPTRMTASVMSGAVVRRSKSVDLDAAQWEQAWKERLTPLDAPLAALLAAMGAQRARLCVLYDTPSAAVDLVSLPVTGRAAIDAARLAIADSISCDPDAAPVSSVVLCRDSVGAPPLTHTLACADQDEPLETLYAWVERSGARVRSAAPGDAMVVAAMTRLALGDTADVHTAHVFIGEHATTIGVGHAGRLAFVRTVEVGVAALWEPLARLYKGEEHARSLACALLAETGVPSPGEVLDRERGILADDALPAIQPVLQRLFIELKQSIRFGLSREDAARASIVVHGPGACIPHLAEGVAEQVGLRYTPPPAPTGANRLDFSMLAHLPGPAPALDLVPIHRQDRRTGAALRRGLIGGTVAASLFLLAEGGLAWQAARTSEAQLRTMKASLTQAERLTTTNDTLDSMRAALDAARARLDTRMRTRPAWGAWLHDFAQATPERVRITGVVGELREGAPVVVLRGHAGASAGEDAAGAIRAFVNALEAGPLVERVDLGSTSRIRTPLGDAQRFELTLTLVSPPFATWDAHASVQEGAR